METRVIVAQQYTTKQGVQGWTVGITGEKRARMFFHIPVKAMKFAFILKKQTGLNISENCLVRLSQANKIYKDMVERAKAFEQSADNYFGKGMENLAEIEGKHMEP